jgi:hypothetical protein
VKAQPHPNKTATLGAPPGMEDSVYALEVRHYEGEGGRTVESLCTPSAEDLLWLIDGGYLALRILGNSMPPVRLDVLPHSLVHRERLPTDGVLGQLADIFRNDPVCNGRIAVATVQRIGDMIVSAAEAGHKQAQPEWKVTTGDIAALPVDTLIEVIPDWGGVRIARVMRADAETGAVRLMLLFERDDTPATECGANAIVAWRVPTAPPELVPPLAESANVDLSEKE